MSANQGISVRQRRKIEVNSSETPSEEEVLKNGSAEFTWLDPSTWTASKVLAPIGIAVFGVVLSQGVPKYMASEPGFNPSTYKSCQQTFNYTFFVNAAQDRAEKLASHSWEYGTASEAILELLDPRYTVFGQEPFPADKIPSFGFSKPHALDYVEIHIRHGEDKPTLYADDWGVSDPAALGVSAVLLGQRDKAFLQAAAAEKNYLLKDAPRYSNGAISHRTQHAELWSDAISMFPPFLAYYAVASNDLDLMREAVQQCASYRDVLRIDSGEKKGLWKHIVGPSEMADDGVWSTGAAWAAYGMVRVRATINGWRPSNETMAKEKSDLDSWIGEIIDGAMRTDDDESGLLRNYLGDSNWFGETSGTSLLTAAVYRMAVQRPDVFGREKYLNWADSKRRNVVGRVDHVKGLPSPAVDPLKHGSRQPIDSSPEGASFLIMMGSAWRDCVCAGVCKELV